ncbi:DNA polymerase III subunit delta' [Craterilacuibacter sinensis]|uniref:DNA polymerase III subunit delta n=1 Tax=Craterilacuibacter sinensis TaxID=2686017 RepID=A0A845BLU2_9NEIS|nr:DNA polymerase III subunit delta' [Craterilacuibacter sinensis]MXR37305.1 DNA polymerase III subunit delta' [Craterilacuibacter sinensis]
MLYPWHQADWARISSEFSRLPNAWLFTGMAGSGKLEFAEHLAQALLCDQPLADHGACGQCESCRWFGSGSHPDFRRLSPIIEGEEEGKEGKPTRKLAQIKIEAVREIIEFSQLSSHRHGQRVVLVEPAETLNPAAANALLKVLEEPPDDVLFLLVAHSPQRLLPTIKSRCRQYPLARPSHEMALAWLKSQGIARAEIELAHNGGAPLFNHDPALTALRDQFVAALAAPMLTGMLDMAELVDKQKLPLAVPLDWLAKWLHDLAGLSLACRLRYYPEHEDALSSLARRARLPELMRCQSAVTTLVPYGQHTLNVRLQLEALLMDYLKVFA